MNSPLQDSVGNRVLLVNNFHYRRAGSDACFLDQDALFRKHGWNTAVFSMKHAENLPSQWEEHFVDEIEFTRDYSAFTRARIAGKVLYSREARERIAGLLKRFAPDFIHLHSIYHHISPAILPVLARRRVPIVMTAHDYKLACPAYKMFDGRSICEDCRGERVLPLIRKACLHGSRAVSALVALETSFHRARGYYRRYIDRIICPSRFMLEKLAEWGWARSQLTHVPNFFDTSIWQPAFGPGRYFLYFGRLAPEKGLHTLIRAAALSGCPVRIVGWGALRAELEALAARLSAPVEFIDRLKPADLAPIIQQARAVVAPSEWYENASLALLEAFACGKPGIAARIGGNPELVTEGENGWLFEAGDTEALAQRMQAVSNAPDDEVEQQGRRAHARVTRDFGADRHFDSLVRLYAQLEVNPPEHRPS